MTVSSKKALEKEPERAIQQSFFQSKDKEFHRFNNGN